jgi:outer membrane receptor for ferrienterochelin and colicin
LHKLIIALGIIELLAPAVVLGQTIPPTTGQTTGLSGPATASASEEVIVTGTRQQGRTRQQSPAPIDVISAAELRQTGQQNVFDALNKSCPRSISPALVSTPPAWCARHVCAA